MTDGTPPDPAVAAWPTRGPSPEDIAALRKAVRKKLLGAALVAAIGVGASIMSCVGQSFSLRQARALEGIEQQLRQIQTSCPTTKEVTP